MQAMVEGNMDLARGICCADDLVAMEMVVDEHKKLTQDAAMMGVRPSRAGIRTASRGDEAPLVDARQLLPAGATLDKDTTLHHRWIGKVPKTPKPNFVSKAWGGGKKDSVNEREALSIVLNTLWEWRTAKFPKEICPFDLSPYEDGLKG